MIELGGNITLEGFRDRDYAELIVVKKVVGQYTRRLHDTVKDFSHLTVTLKNVDKQFELHAKAEVDGRQYVSAVTGRNIFVALDAALKKVLAQVSK